MKPVTDFQSLKSSDRALVEKSQALLKDASTLVGMTGASSFQRILGSIKSALGLGQNKPGMT